MPAKVFLEQEMYLNLVCQNGFNILMVKKCTKILTEKYCFLCPKLTSIGAYTLPFMEFYRQKLFARAVLSLKDTRLVIFPKNCPINEMMGH